jgi:uncharacterized protein (DUF2062 family)
MRKQIRRFLPSHEAVHNNRWLAPFANTLLHPRLWHLNRHSAAGAVAAGLFCGLIPGPLQMFGAALCCLVFRVNLPLALVTTLYTNPLTIVPLYIAAYAIGDFILGTGIALPPPPAYDFRNPGGWIQAMSTWTYGLGKPLLIGLVLLASGLAVAGYFATKTAWRWHLVRAWKRRQRRPENSTGKTK